jgi:thiamine biosynthesis lipoprotein
MGTVFTIDIRDRGDWAEVIRQVVAWLHHVDAVFSTYRAQSDISRIGRGELRLSDADPRVAEVLGHCADLQDETGGHFTARRGSRIDPTGLVKGWAIERASDLLRAAGSSNHVVNGGGDLQVAGESEPGQPWLVGIADPRHAGSLISVVPAVDCAVATSGTAERGAHIVDPHTGKVARGLLSVSVTGPRLTRVDAYATAAFAMGVDGLRWIDSRPGYEALVVDRSGMVSGTRGWLSASGGTPRPTGAARFAGHARSRRGSIASAPSRITVPAPASTPASAHWMPPAAAVGL